MSKPVDIQELEKEYIDYLSKCCNDLKEKE